MYIIDCVTYFDFLEKFVFLKISGVASSNKVPPIFETSYDRLIHLNSQFDHWYPDVFINSCYGCSGKFALDGPQPQRTFFRETFPISVGIH